MISKLYTINIVIKYFIELYTWYMEALPSQSLHFNIDILDALLLSCCPLLKGA